MELAVPYIVQESQGACGAAALQMIYRYFDVEISSQAAMMDQYKKLEPHGSGKFCISTDNLIVDAKSRGLEARWDRIPVDDEVAAFALLKGFLDQEIPIIVCQQFSQELPLIGHFRVVVGYEDNILIAHDPHPIIGGASQHWSVEDFCRMWKATGENVTGGVYVIIKPT